jgi:hypothetical protein
VPLLTTTLVVGGLLLLRFLNFKSQMNILHFLQQRGKPGDTSLLDPAPSTLTLFACLDAMCGKLGTDLAGHHIMLRLNAATRCFDVFRSEQFIKSVSIKGLCGKQMPLEAYIDLMRERARSEERQRLLRQRRAHFQAGQGA